MLVLALDTTTRVGSCALARHGVLVCETGSEPGKSHAEHLPGDLIALLESERVGLDAIDVFAVATGPGSFTGLRVGIATMQGLAFAMGKPLIGVSGLDALAAIGGRESPTVTTWIDAWRGEVYAARYEDGRAVEAPAVEHPAVILERLRGAAPTLFIGDGAGTFAVLIQQTLGAAARIADPVAPLLAGEVARLAYEMAQAGAHPPPDAIRPLYVRRPDAERSRDARADR